MSEEMTVDALGAAGDGLAWAGGRRVAVPGALPGERIRARIAAAGRGPATAEEIVLLAPSPARSVPPCPHFGACGGCTAQHMADGLYAEWKITRLVETLAQAGVAAPPPASLARTPPGARRRAELAALGARGGALLGFHARGSSRIEPIAACAVLRPELAALLPALRDLLSTLLPPRAAADAALQIAGPAIELTLTLAATPDLAQRERLAAFAASARLARIAWRRSRDGEPEVIVQRAPVRADFSGVGVDLPPDAFLQASAEGEAAIAAAVRAHAGGARSVADLYAGAGTLTFALEAAVRVHAVEGRKAAADALLAGARAAGRSRVSAESRDLARRPLLAGELGRFDAVIFDPPRAGAAAQVREIARARPKRVVAVSCNPASFARDARVLIDGGYRLTALVPIDQFLWSPHLELVAAFER